MAVSARAARLASGVKRGGAGEAGASVESAAGSPAGS